MIRGRDGFEKAIAYSIALLVPTIPLRLIQAQPLLGTGHLVQMVQTVTFFLILALAFDLRTLKRFHGSSRDLIAVYGLTTVTAYSTSIIIATVSSVTGKDLLPLLVKLVKHLAGINS